MPLYPSTESSWLELMLNLLRNNFKSKFWFVKTKLFEGKEIQRILSNYFPIFPGFLLLKWIGLFTSVGFDISRTYEWRDLWHNSTGIIHHSLSSCLWGQGLGGQTWARLAHSSGRGQQRGAQLKHSSWMSSHRGLLHLFLFIALNGFPLWNRLGRTGQIISLNLQDFMIPLFLCFKLSKNFQKAA